MESIKEIFRIGYGPSSSHTMGPREAAKLFLSKVEEASHYTATLYGSLAATGKGHLTDVAILSILGDTKTTLVWKPDIILEKHPNAVKFEAYDEENNLIHTQTSYSIGGGALIHDNETNAEAKEKVYELSDMEDILKWCQRKGTNFWEFVEEVEGKDIWNHLEKVWDVMQKSIKKGTSNEGVLPGGLNVPRKAASYYIRSRSYKSSLKRRSQLFAFALAVSEENAGGGKIVTAPTCGSCGVLPSVLYYLQLNHKVPKARIIRALATAGLVGNIVKENASISGAEVGCQGEVGTACAMAAAAAAQIFGQTPSQIEYAAEMGLEHHLGLTCDPVCGLVQIPCIERNAFAAARALDSAAYSILSDGVHRVSFDKIVHTMKQTGHDLPSIYKETSMGGLALFANEDNVD